MEMAEFSNGPLESVTLPIRKSFEYDKFDSDDISCVDVMIDPDSTSTTGILPGRNLDSISDSDKGMIKQCVRCPGWPVKKLFLVLLVVGILAWNGYLQTTVNKMAEVHCKFIRHADCESLMRSSCHKNGVYTIYPSLGKPLSVFCDQTTDGGGWIVIQRRVDGKVNFNRNWSDYKTGFGDLTGSMWLGNEAIHTLTTEASQVRIDLEDHDEKEAYAKFSLFRVGDEKSGYKLHVGGYAGTTGESWHSGFVNFHNGMLFTTYDRDNDKWRGGNCGVLRKGGWWYNNCARVHLNGRYSKSKTYGGGTGNFWYDWRKLTALKYCEMKVRRKDGKK